MGCGSSKQPTSAVPSAKAAKRNKKSAKDDDPQELDDEAMHKMRENILQRHDSEVDIIAQISAEREALKMISSIKIERKYSCEDLLDTMEAKDLAKLNDNPDHFRAQKQLQSISIRKALQNKCKRWVILNNLGALSSSDVTALSNFLLRIIRSLQKKKSEGNDHLEWVNSQYGTLEPSSIGVLDRAIRSLNVVTMAPVSEFTLRQSNLYDFDLPPGLVTIHEVRLIIDVYRRGGKLVPKAVHKLLRLSYRLLKGRSNTSKVDLRQGDKLIVVGDIHGQLADLFHILDAVGLPSPTTKYIFNGDFVDRGPNGVEVMCVLLALLIARPDCVFLNRGNHEDFAICSVYGFQLECYEKYDPLTFGLFVEVFQQIPLFAVVNEAIFVVHGGLFHSDNATLEDLDAIDRTAFTLEEMPEDGESLEAVDRANQKAFLQQLIRDALWSDPVSLDGKHPSARGAGVSFGPDVTESFLLQNNLRFVIRSHECIRSGYDEPYAMRNSTGRIGGSMLCTIFSASDYGGSGNSAAYLEFVATTEEELPLDSPVSHRSRRSSSALMRQHSMSENTNAAVDNISEVKRVHGTNLQYTVHYFYASPLYFATENQIEPHRETNYDLAGIASNLRTDSGETGEAQDVSRTRSSSMERQRCPRGEILIGSSISIEELICIRKQLLLEAFERGDRNQVGQISQQYWLRAMTDVLSVTLSWRHLAKYFIKEDMTSVGGEADCSTSEIRYIDFLNSFDDDVIFGRGSEDRSASLYWQGRTEKASSIATQGTVESSVEPNPVAVEDIQLEDGTPARQHNPASDLSLVHPTQLSAQEESYFGHSVSSEVISAIYSSYEKLEEAFKFFDTDGDNSFSLDDLLEGCAALDLISQSGDPSDKASSASTSTYSEEDIVRFMEMMDVFGNGFLDINIFFEMFRLSLLSSSMMNDQHWTKPLLTREFSFTHDYYRLSSHGLSLLSPVSASSTPGGHTHGLHTSQLAHMGSLELRKGVEISVDRELISSSNDGLDQVGLSIDI